jgi:hypothetical protein
MMQTIAAAVPTICSQEAAARRSPLPTLKTPWTDMLAGPMHAVTSMR